MHTPRLKRLTTLLGRLPGVGEKTAQRYLLHLLTADAELVERLALELQELRRFVAPCERCGNLTELATEGEQPICSICRDPRRDDGLLCIVARVVDLMAIERSGAMRGRYFVLGKLLSPLDGVGPEELPIGRLRDRIRDANVKELIIATPPSVEGEATSLLLKRELASLGVDMTRIASGVPHGGDLEFADPITMVRALAGRQTIE